MSVKFLSKALSLPSAQFAMLNSDTEHTALWEKIHLNHGTALTR